MSRDDIQKLLGGYATGTLTPEERRVLFEAALEDQELFDALGREEALRGVLSDPSARAQLLAAMDDVPAPWYRTLWRPAPMAALATVLLMVVGVAVWQSSRTPPRRMAKLELPPLPQAVQMERAPTLPPPPELARAAPALAPYSLPASTPGAPPPPPPAAVAEDEAVPVSAGPVPAAAPKDAAIGVFGGALPAPPAQQAQAGVQGQLQPATQPSARSAFAGKAAEPQITVPLHGTVTDRTGAGIRSASVVVKSLATGAAITTSTDEHGEFSAPEAPGGVYQISASAPGFRPATVSSVTPALGTPEPVNVRLDVGAAAETVVVTAATGALMSPAGLVGGRGGGGGAMAKKASPAAAAVLEYHLMRRMPAGDLVEVPVDGSAPAGAALILRVTPRANGYLRIAPADGPTIANRQVQARREVETALPEFNTPGRVELRMYFSPQPIGPEDRAPTAAIAFNIR